jgi:serine/threonine protein kinase
MMKLNGYLIAFLLIFCTSVGHAEAIQHSSKKQISQAMQTARKIKQQDRRLRLSVKELTQVVLFIEKEFSHCIQNGKYYIPKGQYNLPASIEFDPATKHTFIHARNILGMGGNKVVRKSIMYNRSHPQVVASCRQIHSNPNEQSILRSLTNGKGIMPFYTALSHEEDGSMQEFLICKLYKDRSFDQFLEKNRKLPIRDKLIIASQMLQALETLHSRNICHLDLKKNNFLIQKNPSKKKPYEVALSDFGLSQPVDTLKGSPVDNLHSLLNRAPEAYLRSHFTKRDYYAAEIFSLGSIFYELLYGKEPTWFEHTDIQAASPDVRYAAHLQLLERGTLPIQKALLKKEKRGKSLTKQERFEKIILQMVHKDPSSRGSAKKLRIKLERIR